MNDYFLLFGLVGALTLLLCSAFFSSSETSVLATNRHKLRSQLRGGSRSRGARLLQRLLRQQETLLASILLGNNLSNILLSSLVTLITIRIWGDSMVAVSSLVLTVVVLVFAEITPKSYALRNADKLARLFAYALVPINWLLRPLSLLIIKFANLLIARPSASKAGDSNYSLDDIRSVVSDPGTILSTRHRDILISILDLEQLSASDALVSRKNLVSIDLEHLEDFDFHNAAMLKHSKVVVYEGKLEQAEGLVRTHDLLALRRNQQLSPGAVRSRLEKPLFVPETQPLLSLFMQLRAQQAHSCFVVDEYGALQGMITLSDLLDEIMGDINPSYAPSIAPKASGDGYLIDGKVNVRLINKKLGWNLPQDQGVTLHGLIIEQLETLPEGNVCLQVGAYQVQTVEIAEGFVRQAELVELELEEED